MSIIFSSDKQHKIWVIIPNAGVGVRMSAKCPKQYLLLGDKTIIAHSLDCFLNFACFAKIIVTLHPADSHWATLKYAQHPMIETVQGGSERCHSVLNGLHALSTRAAAGDWILVHDAARPCITVSLIKKLLTEVAEHPIGGILGVRIHETVKRVDQDYAVTATLDRNELWCAQTPQMFRYGVLYNALQIAIGQQFYVTDEASAIERIGAKPLMIESEYSNLKITHPNDLVVAASFKFSSRHV